MFLSDSLKLVLTFFKAYFKKLSPKNTEYRNYKNFNENNFLHKLDQELSKGSLFKEKHHQYGVFTNIFRIVLDKYAPIKIKIVSGNEAPFMTKELSKAIMNKYKPKNRYTKWSSRKNFLTFKEQRISVRILKKKRTTFPKLLQME